MKALLNKDMKRQYEEGVQMLKCKGRMQLNQQFQLPFFEDVWGVAWNFPFGKVVCFCSLTLHL